MRNLAYQQFTLASLDSHYPSQKRRVGRTISQPYQCADGILFYTCFDDGVQTLAGPRMGSNDEC